MRFRAERSAWAAALIVALLAWAAIWMPESWRVWGFDALRDLRLAGRTLLTAASLLAGAALALAGRSKRPAAANVALWAVVLLATILVLLFPARTPLRGDGQFLLDSLALNKIVLLRSPLSAYVDSAVHHLLGESEPMLTYRVIGLAGWVLQLGALVLLLRRLPGWGARLLAGVLLLFNGAMLVHAGVPERYSLVYGLALLALVLSVNALRAGRYPWAGLAVTLLASGFHFQAVLFLPAFVLPLARRIGRRRVWLLFAGLGAAGLAAALLLARKHLLAPFGPGDGSLARIWLRHLLDLANLLLWGGAGALTTAAALPFMKRNGTAEWGTADRFLLGGLLATAGFLLVFRADLGVARDADLLVLFQFPLALLLVERLRSREKALLATLAGAALVAAGFTTTGALIRQSDTEASLRRQVRVLRIDSHAQAPYGWEFVGQYYMEQGELKKAREAFETAFRLSGNARYTMFLANLELMRRDYGEAESWARIAAERLPDNQQALSLLGISLYYLERYDEAAETLSRAIRKGASGPTYLLLLADSELQRGQPETAIQMIERGVGGGVQPTPMLLTVLGEAYEETGQRELAARIYQQVLQAGVPEPFRGRARSGLERLQ